MHTRDPLLQPGLIDDDEWLTAEQLARLCDRQLEWVLTLAEAGIVTRQTQAAPQSWRLGSADVRRARAISRLQLTYGAPLDAAALILNLQEEVLRLRAQLRASLWHTDTDFVVDVDI